MADEVRISDDGADRSDGAARCMMAVRRMMRDTITTDLVSNPAIDMLLALYLGRHEGAFVPAGQVCEATGASAEVCRRWGLALEKRGLVVIDDERYRLTPLGEATMKRVNDEVWRITAARMSIADLASGPD